MSSFNDLKYNTLSNGETIAYREQSPSSGSGDKVLIFLHATMCSSQMLDTGGLLEKIKSALPTYRIIAVDLRGNGHSSYKNKISKLEDFAGDVKELLANLKINKYTIFATCLGGFVSHVVAMNNQNIENLIICGGLLHLGGAHMFHDHYPTSYEDTVNTGHYKYVQGWINNNDREGLRQGSEGFHAKTWTTSSGFDKLLDEMFLSRNLKEVFYGEAICNTSNENNGKVAGSGDVSKISCRTLIIHGEGDLTVPVAHARNLHNVIKGSKLVVLDAAHFTWYDKLDETVNALKDFLSNN